MKHMVLTLIFLSTILGSAIWAADTQSIARPVFAELPSLKDLGTLDKRTTTQGATKAADAQAGPEAAPSAATPTTPEPEPEPKQDIYLNFENTELSNFVAYIAELKKLNIIPDKNTAGAKIFLEVRTPISVDQAWEIFLTTLEMYGFTMVKVGDVHKIIPRDGKATEPLPAYIGVPLEKLPDSDITIRYVPFLNNISVNDVSPMLDSMLGQNHRLVPIPNLNGFIITDKAHNIKAAMRVINELDQSGLQEAVVFLRLVRTNALEVKQLLDKLIAAPEQNPLARLLGKKAEGGLEYFSSSTKIVAEERSNTLILLGNLKSIKTIEDFITTYVDTELRAKKSPLHIYEFQFAEVQQIAEILNDVVNSSPDTPAGKFGGVRDGVKYFKSMTFQADERGNRLIVSCTDRQDWKLLKKTLRDLDKPQPQVAVETLVVQITMDDDKELGGQIRTKKDNALGQNIAAQAANLTDPILKLQNNVPVSLLGNLIQAISTAARGSTLFSFGPTAEGSSGVWAVFKALSTQVNASVLSQPFVTIANRAKGKVLVGDQRRIVKETALSDSANPGIQAFENQDVSTTIEYTPQINRDGIINMKISIQLSDFSGTAADSTTSKLLTTNVSVANGQVLVLGGFVRTKVDETQRKSPLLGNIPVLCWLFKNKTRVINKQYIFFFISPTIEKPRTVPGSSIYTKMKLHQAADIVSDAVETERTRDPVHNWFFNPNNEQYSHKVIDFANARYQPTTVDIANDPDYRTETERQQERAEKSGLDTNMLDADLSKLPAAKETAKRVAVLAAPTEPQKPSDDDQLEERRKKLRQLLAPPQALSFGNQQPTQPQNPSLPPPVFPSYGVASPAPEMSPAPVTRGMA